MVKKMKKNVPKGVKVVKNPPLPPLLPLCNLKHPY